MPYNLLIVESPGKIKTISKYLGNSYHVLSCNGHIRDLPEKAFGIDVANNFAPTYVVSPNKQGIITTLKKEAQGATQVFLASDDDREGESISFHLQEVLNLPQEKVKRIVFREITRSAIEKAIANPRSVDLSLVRSQQTRRFIDRIVGYEGSPVAWRKVKQGLSVGRVQSVAVRIVVDRERAIYRFKPTGYYKVKATFAMLEDGVLSAELSEHLPNYEEALQFISSCQGATYTIQHLKKHTLQRKPPVPFITSTLQQEASRLLGFSVKRTMLLAQQLYEAGHITYMRTDGMDLSEEALAATKEVITSTYGPDYYKRRIYKSKNIHAQEAHEAIRPTRMAQQIVTDDESFQRLYDLIRQRTLASQMHDAITEKTTVTIAISTRSQSLIAQGEIRIFDGFLAAYPSAKTKEKLLPPLIIGQQLQATQLQARERYTTPPARYTEATLVRELEERGIGRPSTYAPTINTVQQRRYVVKEDRPGTTRTYQLIQLVKGKVSTTQYEECKGKEKNKLFPTDIGMVTHDFLTCYFPQVVDYNFTASVEQELDEIAKSNKVWHYVIQAFYKEFKPCITSALEAEELPNQRVLGHHPTSGEPIIARFSRRTGSLVQIGSNEEGNTPRFASLRPHQRLEHITLEEALELFKLPREVGTLEGTPIIAHIGRYGPYLKHQESFYALDKALDPYTITEEEAIPFIHAKREAKAQSLLQTFAEEPNIEVRKGRWGPYIRLKEEKKNIKLPTSEDPGTITLQRCLEIIANPPTRNPKRKKSKP